MKSTFSLLMIVCVLLICGCKSNQNGGGDGDGNGGSASVKIDQVTFGNYGGFTGQRLEYTVSKDGSVSLFDSNTKQTTPYAKWSQGTTDQIFQDVDALEIQNISFQSPGNMSYFVGVILEGKRTDVVWGRGDKTPPADVKEMYDRLIAKTKEE